MLGSLSKKQVKTTRKSNQYPNYVGDLPVKLIQDIIDSFALTGDWTEIAGRTGITEKQIRLLKSRYKDDPTEIARVVFDQWLCRIPKPKDLAYLLIYVKRYKDAEKLKDFIHPDEWAEIAKRMRRVRGVHASRSTVTDPIIEYEYEALEGHRQITSEEESSLYRPLSSSQPTTRTRGPPGVFSANSSTTYTSRSGRTGTSMSDRTTDRESDVLSLGPLMVPCAQTPIRESSPFQELEVHKYLEKSLEFKLPYSLQRQPLSEHQHHPNIIPYFILNQRWVIKDFSKKDHECFFNELRALTLLRHPNIIPLAGYCRLNEESKYSVEDVVQHLILPRMDNGDLQEYMLRNPAAKDVETRLNIVCQIGHALGFIHYLNFVHGDLKLTNILIDKYGHPYLSDFELTVPVDELESSDNMRDNKKIYCSVPFFPANGRLKRYERDIYAFGIVLAYVFALRQPIDGHKNMDGESLVNELFGDLVDDHTQIRHHIHNLCLDCVKCADSADLKKGGFPDDEYAIVRMTNTLESQIFWSNNTQNKGEDVTQYAVYETAE